MRISVIIPIYNSEKYLDSCIKSVLNQTFEDFELILVDDGSTDNSYQISKVYADADPRVVLVKQSNGGVSSARNCGLELVSSKYVTFIDSDDYIAPDFLETLHSKINNPIDFLFSGMEFFNSDFVIKSIKPKDYSWDLNKEEDFISFLYQPLQTSPCAKLYSYEIIRKFNLRFDTSLFCAEDRDFNMIFFSHIHHAVSISYTGYFYRRDVHNSLTKRANPNAFKYRCIHWGMRHDMCQEKHFDNVRTQIKLANDLYSITNNEVMRISRYVVSYGKAISLCKEKMSFVDFAFLKQWKRYITAPRWQSFLLLHNCFSFLVIIYKLYLYGKQKS